MQVRELKIPGVFEFVPPQFPDNRGSFIAPYSEIAFREATGHGLHLAQVNTSISAKNVIRGVHFATVPPGQAKYVYATSGAFLDVVVDLRVGSPTFGVVDYVRLDTDTRAAIFVPDGIGHSVLSLADDSTLNYLCSTGYNPGGEHTINAFDPAFDFPWLVDSKYSGRDFILSDRDAAAPLHSAATDVLPNYADCQA
jgi:dTDP-4-dehydrorhamnose 3,5-epimerase